MLRSIQKALIDYWKHEGQSTLKYFARVMAGYGVYVSLYLIEWVRLFWDWFKDYGRFQKNISGWDIDRGYDGKPHGRRKSACDWAWHEGSWRNVDYDDGTTIFTLGMSLGLGVMLGLLAYHPLDWWDFTKPVQSFWIIIVVGTAFYPLIHRLAKFNSLKSLYGTCFIVLMYGFLLPVLSYLFISNYFGI